MESDRWSNENLGYLGIATFGAWWVLLGVYVLPLLKIATNQAIVPIGGH